MAIARVADGDDSLACWADRHSAGAAQERRIELEPHRATRRRQPSVADDDVRRTARGDQLVGRQLVQAARRQHAEGASSRLHQSKARVRSAFGEGLVGQ
jgi:hypothetical protein